MMRRALRNKPILIGVCVVMLVTLAAILAPALATHNPIDTNLPMRLKPPGEAGHLMGTDPFGRDIWSRLVFGGRISLQVGLLAVGVGAICGLALGTAAGYLGGWTDLLVGRLLDIIMAFPTVLLALAIVAALGPSLTNSIIAIGITTVPRFARVIRGSVLAVREREYVLAASALGARPWWVLLSHVLPNVTSPLIVVTSLGIANAILVEASLSFLGLGVAPPTPTWGSMITDGKQYLDSAPWISGFSGLAIMTSVLGFNLFGDGLRDLLDPRLKV